MGQRNSLDKDMTSSDFLFKNAKSSSFCDTDLKYSSSGSSTHSNTTKKNNNDFPLCMYGCLSPIPLRNKRAKSIRYINMCWRDVFYRDAKNKNFKWCSVFSDSLKKFRKNSEEKIFEDFCDLKDELNIHNVQNLTLKSKSLSQDIRNEENAQNEKLFEIFQALESESESENDQPCDSSFINNISNVDSCKKSEELLPAKMNVNHHYTKIHYFFNMIGKESFHSLKYFKKIQFEKISNFLSKVLNDKKNFFGHLIEKYKEYFLGLYADALLQMKNDKGKNSQFEEEKINAEKDEDSLFYTALTDVKYFTRTLTNSLFLFFDLENFKRKSKNFLFNKENILNIVISVIVREKIFFCLLAAQISTEEFFTQKLKEKSLYYSNFPPEKFEVPPKFCLNEKTREYIREKNNMNRELKILNFKPYEKTMNKLKDLVNLDDPIKKINLIMYAAEIMQKEIIDFYEGHGVTYSEKIGGDELLTVFIYIIANLKIFTIYSELIIINNFLSSTLVNSIAGYYLTTMMIACKYLADFNSESFIMRKE